MNRERVYAYCVIAVGIPPSLVIGWWAANSPFAEMVLSLCFLTAMATIVVPEWWKAWQARRIALAVWSDSEPVAVVAVKEILRLTHHSTDRR